MVLFISYIKITVKIYLKSNLSALSCLYSNENFKVPLFLTTFFDANYVKENDMKVFASPSHLFISVRQKELKQQT